MKREDINRQARKIYALIIGDRVEQEPWAEAPSSVKTFYRKIGRWHLEQIQEHEKTITLYSDAFDDLTVKIVEVISEPLRDRLKRIKGTDDTEQK